MFSPLLAAYYYQGACSTFTPVHGIMAPSYYDPVLSILHERTYYQIITHYTPTIWHDMTRNPNNKQSAKGDTDVWNVSCAGGWTGG